MHVLITGGTGFIGRALVRAFLNDDHRVTVLSRSKKKMVHGASVVTSLLDVQSNVDVVINLAGASINKRWTHAYKKTLVESRLNVTQQLIDFMHRTQVKPDVFISASAVGYYGSHSFEEQLNELSKPYDEFTHQLCKQWEEKAFEARELGVRTCVTRFGVVLGKHGGALKQMSLPFKVGLGARIGNGKQPFSWVHLDDVVQSILFLIQHKEAQGVFNVTAPECVTNAVLTKSLADCYGLPAWNVMPPFMVHAMFGEMGEILLLKGQNVQPKRLQEIGYIFKYPQLLPALKSIY